MVKNFKTKNEEIDNLIELIYTLWKSKWKIVVAVVISFTAMISYQSFQTNNFTATTEIKPMSTLQLNRLYMINNLIENTNTNSNINTNTNTNINTSERDAIAEKSTKLSSTKLLNLYFEILNERTVFESAIREFNLLEASQYNNEQEYSEAIIRLASSIKILSPSVSANTKKGNLETSYHTINFTHHDAEKWKSILRYVDEFGNKLVKKNLVDEYNNSLLFLTDQKKYQLEDISIKMNNHLIDYERETSDYLAYLEEQSAIAKKLGIAKNTIEVQTFGNQNALLSNVQTDSPFYLRGYEAIDKEIELIELRKDKNAFIGGLFKLEKEKRAIEQDQTIERVKLALQATLPETSNEFSAASLNIITTKFEYKDNKTMLVLAIVIGLVGGIFYVLIFNTFQTYRISKKN